MVNVRFIFLFYEMFYFMKCFILWNVLFYEMFYFMKCFILMWCVLSYYDDVLNLMMRLILKLYSLPP